MAVGKWAAVLVGLGCSLACAARANAQRASKEPAVRAAIAPPELTHFEPAPYPPQAAAQRLEADVVLALDIDAAGHVTRAVVSEAGGHGFDEAAQSAALRFLFRPARRAD